MSVGSRTFLERVTIVSALLALVAVARLEPARAALGGDKG